MQQPNLYQLRSALPGMGKAPRFAEVRRQHLDIAAMPIPAFRRVYAYWQAKRGERFAPARRDIDPIDLREVLASTMLIEVASRDPWSFRYRLAGTETSLIHGAELTGRGIDKLRPKVFAELLHRDLAMLATSGAPQFVQLEFVNEHGLPRGYHVLRLPLSSDGQKVDIILAVSDYGADRRALSEIFQGAHDAA
jgi:hypothetical protein